MLVDFFTKEVMPASGSTLAEFLEKAGLHGKIALDNLVQAPRDLSVVLEAEDPELDRVKTSMVQAATKRIITEFKSQGTEVVICMVNMQSQGVSGEKYRELREHVERLAKTCGRVDGQVSTRFELKGVAGGTGVSASDMITARWRKMREMVKAGIVPV
ncbi:unnamed protein product [Discosporangium mesarthrocarpum]